VHDAADGQAEKFVDRAHPFRVARGEVVVDRNKVPPRAGEGIEINRLVATSVLPSPVAIPQ